MLQPRSLVVLEKNSKAQIIESHSSLTGKQESSTNSVDDFIEPLTNSLTEIHINENSKLDYYKIQNDVETSSIIDNTYIDQKSNSEVSCHTFSFGGNIVRNNLNFYQNGTNVNSILKGVTTVSYTHLTLPTTLTV